MRTSPFHLLSTSLSSFLLIKFLIHPPPPPPPTTTDLSPTTTAAATAMSTDLQLRQDLPPIRLTSLKIKLPESLSTSCTIQSEEENDEIEDECRTPTSPENRIPEIVNCPPAPKKQRLSAPNCKRRLSEFQFFEIVARDEVESFFKSSYEFIDQNSNTNKRRRSLL